MHLNPRVASTIHLKARDDVQKGPRPDLNQHTLRAKPRSRFVYHPYPHLPIQRSSRNAHPLLSSLLDPLYRLRQSSPYGIPACYPAHDGKRYVCPGLPSTLHRELAASHVIRMLPSTTVSAQRGFCRPQGAQFPLELPVLSLRAIAPGPYGGGLT
jgi:hypothetical protein